MTDGTESTEDALRRIAGKCVELEAWQQKYREAAELWDALNLSENGQVTHAVLIVKEIDFDTGITRISTCASDGTDWVDQLGMYEACKLISAEKGMDDDGD